MNVLTLEHRLLEILKQKAEGRWAYVCFSGGLDSALVLAACLRAGLATTAVMAVGPSLASEEREDALALARLLGAELEEFEAREWELPAYRANMGDRCYHCKGAIYRGAERLAAERHPGAFLLNGTQVEDLDDIRPGLKAAEEHQVFSPLLEAGLNKADIRALARHWNLPLSEKPATPCLASRFPVGTEVTPERLAQVANVESFLRAHGLWPARARWHESVVRLEIEQKHMAKALEEPLRTELEAACRKAGFCFAAVDLKGIQSGSLALALGSNTATRTEKKYEPVMNGDER